MPPRRRKKPTIKAFHSLAELAQFLMNDTPRPLTPDDFTNPKAYASFNAFTQVFEMLDAATKRHKQHQTYHHALQSFLQLAEQNVWFVNTQALLVRRLARDVQIPDIELSESRELTSEDRVKFVQWLGAINSRIMERMHPPEHPIDTRIVVGGGVPTDVIACPMDQYEASTFMSLASLGLIVLECVERDSNGTPELARAVDIAREAFHRLTVHDPGEQTPWKRLTTRFISLVRAAWPHVDVVED